MVTKHTPTQDQRMRVLALHDQYGSVFTDLLRRTMAPKTRLAQFTLTEINNILDGVQERLEAEAAAL